jgi:hypothetical protein
LRRLVGHPALLNCFAPTLPVKIRKRIGPLEREHIPRLRFSVYTVFLRNIISSTGTPDNYSNQYIKGTMYQCHGIGFKDLPGRFGHPKLSQVGEFSRKIALICQLRAFSGKFNPE